LNNAEALAAGRFPETSRFERIYIIDTGKPLAQWLSENISGEMSKGSPGNKYMESIYPGQLQYSFALELKPNVELKYTMVATVINPYVPSVSASRTNSGTFTLYLNTKLVSAAAGGKTGAALIVSDFPSIKDLSLWGPTRTAIEIETLSIKQEKKIPQAPGVRLEYPLPITPLPIPGQ
jgi:hypothetical protein